MQIGLAFMQYVQDYDEMYPRVYWIVGSSGTNSYRVWYGDMIYPYIKNAQVFQCPSFPGTGTVGFIPAGETPGVPRYAYIMNAIGNNDARWPNTSGERQRVHARHSDGFNALWADGHVKWITEGASKARQWTIQED